MLHDTGSKFNKAYKEAFLLADNLLQRNQLPRSRHPLHHHTETSGPVAVIETDRDYRIDIVYKNIRPPVDGDAGIGFGK